MPSSPAVDEQHDRAVEALAMWEDIADKSVIFDTKLTLNEWVGTISHNT